MEEISRLDSLYVNGASEDLHPHRLSLLALLESIIRYEETFWRQKAKPKWLKDGDRNTKYFHKMENGRKRKNTIMKLII